MLNAAVTGSSLAFAGKQGMVGAAGVMVSANNAGGANQTGSAWQTKYDRSTSETESKVNNNMMRASLYQTASIEAFNLSRSQEGFFQGRRHSTNNSAMA